MRKILITIALICFSGYASASINAAYADVSKEYKVKAAILYKFINFVEWPASNPPAADINVCIIGTDPFGTALAPIENQKLNNVPLHVIRNATDSQVPSCQVLFISKSEEYRFGQILGWVKDKPVLTISEIDGFINKGGMIGFVTDKTVKFEINNASVRKASLRIDAQVLELALNVIDK